MTNIPEDGSRATSAEPLATDDEIRAQAEQQASEQSEEYVDELERQARGLRDRNQTWPATRLVRVAKENLNARPFTRESRCDAFGIRTLVSSLKDFLPDGPLAARLVASRFRVWGIRGMQDDFAEKLSAWKGQRPEEMVRYASTLVDDQELIRTLDAWRETETPKVAGRLATLQEAVDEAFKWAHTAALLSTDPAKDAAFEAIKLALHVLKGDRPRSYEESKADWDERVAETKRVAELLEERVEEVKTAFEKGEAPRELLDLTKQYAGEARGKVMDLRHEVPTADPMPTEHLEALADAIRNRPTASADTAKRGSQRRMSLLVEHILRAASDGWTRPDERPARLCADLKRVLPGELERLTPTMCEGLLESYVPKRPREVQRTEIGIAAEIARRAGAFGFTERTPQDEAVRAFDNAMRRARTGTSAVS